MPSRTGACSAKWDLEKNQVFGYDENDRLRNEVYDDNGNTIIADGRTSEYDFENRPLSMNDTEVLFTYDGDQNRVLTVTGGESVFFLVDDVNPTGYAQVLEEIQEGRVDRVYTYGIDLISQSRGEEVNFYGYDGHGSVRLLLSIDGGITDRIQYDAFGVAQVLAGTTPNKYLYGGEQYDSEVKSYYLRARNYSNETGRFSTMDLHPGESRLPLSLHKYAYGNVNPVNTVDPTGKFGAPLSILIGPVLEALLPFSSVPFYWRRYPESFSSLRCSSLRDLSMYVGHPVMSTIRRRERMQHAANKYAIRL